jgi:hypothetical protein
LRFENFVGSTWIPYSKIAESSAAWNIFREVVQSGSEVNPRGYLRGTPGRSAPLVTLDDQPLRCLYSGDGERLFAIAGSSYYEVFSTKVFPNGGLGPGSFNKRGTVNFDIYPGQIFANQAGNTNQLFIVSGNQGYIDTGVPGQICIPVIPAAAGAYIDGYFVAQQPNSNIFNISDLSAATGGLTWNPLDTGAKQGNPDDLAMVLNAYDLLWLFGDLTTEVWYDSGNNNFPFQRIQGAFFEVGVAAPWSVAKVGNTIMWVGNDVRGQGQVWQAQGYSFPVVASNRAIEQAIQTYPTIADAVGYSYQEDGHTFYVLTFPTANVTWCYDILTGDWHNRGAWNPGKGSFDQDYYGGQTHAFCFGKHLVGDSRSGNIYQQSTGIYTDNGNPIRRLRTAPHLVDENKRIRFQDIELFMQKGTVPASGPGSMPQMMMRFSDDGGETWSNEKWATAGQTGDYKHRVIWRQGGTGRDRCYEISCSEPIPIAWVDCFIDEVVGTG